MKEAIQKIGKAYHPVNFETGELRKADEISESLHEWREARAELNELPLAAEEWRE